jgi:hypothetical protein
MINKDLGRYGTSCRPGCRRFAVEPSIYVAVSSIAGIPNAGVCV